MKDFRCRKPIQMRFKDVDMFGHVNNTVYFEYMDYGKTCYITEVLGDMFDPKHDAMVIVNINCDFMAPTLYDEPVEVLTRVDRIGESSVTFSQLVVNSATGEVKCQARVVMVGYNTASAATITIPDAWRRAIDDYESGVPTHPLHQH